MPRSLRIEKENGVYHIINRGSYRQNIFINKGRIGLSRNACLRPVKSAVGSMLDYCLSAATTEISTRSSGRAMRASTQARAGA